MACGSTGSVGPTNSSRNDPASRPESGSFCTSGSLVDALALVDTPNLVLFDIAAAAMDVEQAPGPVAPGDAADDSRLDMEAQGGMLVGLVVKRPRRAGLDHAGAGVAQQALQ